MMVKTRSYWKIFSLLFFWIHDKVNTTLNSMTNASLEMGNYPTIWISLSTIYIWKAISFFDCLVFLYSLWSELYLSYNLILSFTFFIIIYSILYTVYIFILYINNMHRNVSLTVIFFILNFCDIEYFVLNHQLRYLCKNKFNQYIGYIEWHTLEKFPIKTNVSKSQKDTRL